MTKRNWAKWRDVRSKYVYGKSYKNLSKTEKKTVMASQRRLKRGAFK